MSPVVAGIEQGIQRPERLNAGQEVACELAPNSILMGTKAPAAPTTKDFTTCSFLRGKLIAFPAEVNLIFYRII
jgi:hypothetical protein